MPKVVATVFNTVTVFVPLTDSASTATLLLMLFPGSVSVMEPLSEVTVSVAVPATAVAVSARPA